VLAFEPGCEQYLEREIDEIEWLGDRVYLHLGVCHDDPDNHAPRSGLNWLWAVVEL
jgi:hypothetical protein